jgi:lysophospholipase L1-like esterase
MNPSRIMRGAALAVALSALAMPAAANAAKKPAKQHKQPAAQQLLVSLGDSYASGYQPPAAGKFAGNTTQGFVYQIPPLARTRGWKLKVVNFACGGATTTSILRQKGCPKAALGPGARPYDGTTQVKAATGFIAKHRAQVGLITISIGGNDVTACARDPTTAVPCVANAMGPLVRNLDALVKQVRKAAGPRTRIVGITYPDVILGAYLTPGGQSLATLSVEAFRGLINRNLQAAYSTVRAAFVDVTRATGAYIPLSQTTTLDPYGTIPQAVAKVCTLTWYCAAQDIHARAPGYKLIAELIARTLPNQKK